jgi:hypothetical protein
MPGRKPIRTRSRTIDHSRGDQNDRADWSRSRTIPYAAIDLQRPKHGPNQDANYDPDNCMPPLALNLPIGSLATLDDAIDPPDRLIERAACGVQHASIL